MQRERVQAAQESVVEIEVASVVAKWIQCHSCATRSRRRIKSLTTLLFELHERGYYESRSYAYQNGCNK